MKKQYLKDTLTFVTVVFGLTLGCIFVYLLYDLVALW